MFLIIVDYGANLNFENNISHIKERHVSPFKSEYGGGVKRALYKLIKLPNFPPAFMR